MESKGKDVLFIALTNIKLLAIWRQQKKRCFGSSWNKTNTFCLCKRCALM